ncbi:MAG: hemerythrin domain-containing protein [Candidatus Aureabacteria bacterium]|nr:hemerythrin domain-containing protein [Candidatus Auribacterota bacterium]
MSALIEELKKEHSEIITLLDKVKELGFYSNEGRKILLSTKDLIILHLKKENEKLYPILRKAAWNDERLKKILNIIARDMENVKNSVLQFYEKYSDASSAFEYAKDYGELLWMIGNRVQREEDILFKEYDNLNQQD